MKTVFVIALLLVLGQARADQTMNRDVTWSPSRTREALQIIEDNHQMDRLREMLSPDIVEQVISYSQLKDEIVDSQANAAEATGVLDNPADFVLGFFETIVETIRGGDKKAALQNFDLQENLEAYREQSAIKMSLAPASWDPDVFKTLPNAKVAASAPPTQWYRDGRAAGREAGKWLAKKLRQGETEYTAAIDEKYFDLDQTK